MKVRAKLASIAMLIAMLTPPAMAQPAASRPPLPHYKYAYQTDVYPEKARRANLQGLVVMAFTIGANGRVDKAAFLNTAAPLLQGGAIAILKGLRFDIPKDWPQNGVGQRYTLSVDFKVIHLPCNQASEKSAAPGHHRSEDIPLTVTATTNC